MPASNVPVLAIEPRIPSSDFEWAEYGRKVGFFDVTQGRPVTANSGNAIYYFGSASYTGHTHHIVMEKDKPTQHDDVLKSQKILRQFGVDPFFSRQNLVWAPNYTHSSAYVQALPTKLQTAGSQANVLDILKNFADRWTAGEWASQ